MSTSTTNLGLFKYDLQTDGDSPFSITDALNNNWDKIDANTALKNHTHSNYISTSSLSSTPMVVKTVYQSGTSGYIIYTNGWCMQWGEMPNDTSTSRTITFVKEFADNNYFVLTSEYNTSDSDTAGVDFCILSSDYATTSFRVSCVKSRPCKWAAFGFLKAGQY